MDKPHGGDQPLLVVHPRCRLNPLKRLVALARRNRVLNCSSSRPGRHFQSHRGRIVQGDGRRDIVRAFHKGGGPAFNALIAGEVQVAFPTTGTAGALLKSGKLIPLAVTSPEPSALARPTYRRGGIRTSRTRCGFLMIAFRSR